MTLPVLPYLLPHQDQLLLLLKQLQPNPVNLGFFFLLPAIDVATLSYYLRLKWLLCPTTYYRSGYYALPLCIVMCIFTLLRYLLYSAYVMIEQGL